MQATETRLDDLLGEVWANDVVPLLKDSTAEGRIGRAGLFSVIGIVLGEAIDLGCQIVFRRKTGLGGFLGGTVGAALGGFTPEILNWASAWSKLSPEQRAQVEAQLRNRVIQKELGQVLALLELTPSATLDEMLKSYRRLATLYHPDRNPNDPAAHGKLVALNAAREKLDDAYDRGLLPITASASI